MRILVLAICVLFAGCMANTSESQEEQDIKCGAFDRCNPWFVNSNGVVVHNVAANSACDLACTADGWAGGFCPLIDLGALEASCTRQCNGQIDKTVNPALWQACWANCINSRSIECQAGEEPAAPTPAARRD